jgi:hypothetical protein
MTGHARYTAERTAWLLGIAISACYWLFTFLISSRKLLWNDELYTYYITVLPTMESVWHALLAGGEQTPPFFYVVTRLSVSIFGLNATALRLPEMIGFWVMGGCVAAFVARRSSPLYGVAAGSVPLTTGAYYYASEARPYGLVLGLSALGLLSWQSLSLGRPRVVWLATLALGLGAAVSSHYYGVFVVAAIAAGEIARSLARRRLDGRVWAAFLIALAPLVFQLPLLRAGASYANAFWSPPQWLSIPDFYFNLLAPAVVPLTAVIVATGLYALVVRGPADGAAPALPLHEAAALVAFMALPIACVLVAKLWTGAFANRYAIAAVIGFAALLPLIARRLVAFPALAALVIVLGCWGWFTVSALRELIEPQRSPATMPAVEAAIATIRSVPDPRLRVAVADPHTFTVLTHYAPEDVRRRLVYLADPARALKHVRHNSVERGMLDLVGPWFGMDVEPYDTFLQLHPSFLVYGNFGALAFLNWLVPEVQGGGFRAEFLSIQGDVLFLQVSQEHNGRERASDTP